jgi:hypothetical protein
MTEIKLGGRVRKVMTRMLATGALLTVYAIGSVSVTSLVMTTFSSEAVAQRGKGKGKGGGGGGGAAKRGGGGGGGGRGRGRGNAGAAAVGTAIGVIGGIIATQAARHQADVEYCYRRWGRYFDEETMTVYRHGRRFPCP